MRSRNSLSFALLGSLFLMVLACAACEDTSVSQPLAAESRGGDPMEMHAPIQVAPAKLILDSPGTCVTVQAEIAYGNVDHATIALNGVAPYYVKADNRGELVAKFTRRSIVNIASPPEMTLTLTGLTVSGAPFSGSDTIGVG